MPRPSTRIKRERVNPVNRVAREIDLASAHHGDFTLVDVSNRSEADTRATMRSGAKQTIRRKTRIERLQEAGIIDKDQAIACQWYADAHELGFVANLGVTANYGATGGGGGTHFDHMAKNEAQRQARLDYEFAREAIPEDLVDLFNSVVLGQLGENEFRAVTRNEVLRIGIAAWRLHGQVSHLIAIPA